MRLASHLHLPLQYVLDTTTATEFVLWMEYLDIEERRHKKFDLYMARLTGETRRSWVSIPKDVDDTDFLIPPQEQLQQLQNKPNMKPDIKEIKDYWFAVTGIKNKKIRKKR